MIHWPAIIHFSGDAELVFILNQSQWLEDQDLHSQHYHTADRLIDSDGNLYALTSRIDGKIVPVADGAQIALIALIDLIRAHASQDGQCCVSKFSADSIREAIAMMEQL
ncbi:MAG TPA: DUF4144 family protein [Methylophilaceae bacterium]|nr:DUF4144 family protein [Methylophilaceae bacterium]